MNEVFERTKTIFEANHFAIYNHVQMGEVKRDDVTVYLDIVPESTNPYGAIHGGALFTLADTCAGMTARTDGRKYVTQQSNVYYMRGCSEGRVTAHGTILKRGRQSCIVQTNVYGPDGKELFNGTFTFFCTGEVAVENLSK